ncbi:hypothetical protein L7F22_016556 [Adiantum nelumboides]|nr:hypothetical protein [Adiantum nelumboides]
MTSVSSTITTTTVQSTLDAWSKCDKLDTLFVLFCTSACWLVVPAIGLAYSGYSIRGNGLASYFPALLVMLIVTIQWWAIGYSIAFADGNGIFGNPFTFAFHKGVGAEPVGTIPGILFSMFQMVFCATVCAMAVGGAAERGRIIALVPFIFLWSTFIYCPLAHMVWSEGGMLAKLGVMDFAGGTPVHICSGSSATAMSVYLSRPIFRSKRSSKRTPSHIKLHKPNNINSMLFAMILIWSCWLPFESGTALSLNFKAVMAFCVTQLAAASGSLTWNALSYFESGKKWSLDSATLGMLAGLVMITPAGGFVSLTDAVILGFLGSCAIYCMLKFKFTKKAHELAWVDPADVFATHAFGGVIATLLCGIFGQKLYAGFDGVTDIHGGVLHDKNYSQFFIQLLEGSIGVIWSFSASYFFIALIDCIPGFEVLCTDDELMKGMDASQMLESLVGAHAEDENDYEPFSRPLRLD